MFCGKGYIYLHFFSNYLSTEVYLDEMYELFFHVCLSSECPAGSMEELCVDKETVADPSPSCSLPMRPCWNMRLMRSEHLFHFPLVIFTQLIQQIDGLLGIGLRQSTSNKEKEMDRIKSAIECRSCTASILRISFWKKDYFPASGSNPIFTPKGRTLLQSCMLTLSDLDFLISETMFEFGRWKYTLENHHFVWSHVQREGNYRKNAYRGQTAS